MPSASRIARLLVEFGRRPPQQLRKVLVNGEPGLVVRDADGILSVLTLTLDGGRIVAIDVVRDPGKLTRVADMLPGQGPAETGPSGKCRGPADR
jgi:RNA polymerase sigma-70 factor (ECF subfamily)